jgi:hypothetical protein
MRHKLRFYLCELELEPAKPPPSSEDLFSSLKASLVDVAGESCLGRAQKYLAVRLIGGSDRRSNSTTTSTTSSVTSSSSNPLVLIRGPASEEKHIRAAIILIKVLNHHQSSSSSSSSSCALRIVRVASSMRTLDSALKKRGVTTSAISLFGVGGLSSGKRQH